MPKGDCRINVADRLALNRDDLDYVDGPSVISRALGGGRGRRKGSVRRTGRPSCSEDASGQESRDAGSWKGEETDSPRGDPALPISRYNYKMTKSYYLNH